MGFSIGGLLKLTPLATGAAGAGVGFLSGLSPAWIALIGTLFGGVVLKVTEKYLGRSKEKKDDAKEIRAELRDTVKDQRQEIKDLEDEVNEWRSKYYDLRDSYMNIKTELTLALGSIKNKDTPA